MKIAILLWNVSTGAMQLTFANVYRNCRSKRWLTESIAYRLKLNVSTHAAGKNNVYSFGKECRSASRSKVTPSSRDDVIGFRVARDSKKLVLGFYILLLIKDSISQKKRVKHTARYFDFFPPFAMYSSRVKRPSRLVSIRSKRSAAAQGSDWLEM